MSLEQVLAIRKALSIQAHPDKTLAQKLHAERPDVYKGSQRPLLLSHPLTSSRYSDPNHKVCIMSCV